MPIPVRSRNPLLEVILEYASLMSAVYLGLAVLVEALRRAWPERHVLMIARRLDDLPGTVLRLLGVLPALRRMVAYDELSGWSLRLLFGVTVVAVIFAQAFLTGAVLAVARYFIMRRRRA